VGVNFRPRSWNLLGAATYPIGDAFGLFAKAGVAFTALRASVMENQTYRSSSDRTNPAWGLGAQFGFSSNWALRTEYENFGKFGDTPDFASNAGTGTGTLSLVSASMLYRF
jgi:opacity protein-like surface antigen